MANLTSHNNMGVNCLFVLLVRNRLNISLKFDSGVYEGVSGPAVVVFRLFTCKIREFISFCHVR